MISLQTKLVLACGLIASAAVHADPQPAPMAMPAGSVIDPREAKDPDTATLLAIVGTVVPAGTFIGGLASGNDLIATAGLWSSFVGPSLGHWYARQPVTIGMGIRAGGVVVALVGGLEAFGCPWTSEDGDPPCTKGQGSLITGGVIFVAGAIYDIATAGSATRRWNEHHFQIAPTIVNHGPPGLALTGTF